MRPTSLGRFARDRRGVSAIEFAFMAPVLIATYFAVAELCQAMLAERKVAHAASAMGDLVTQVATVKKADLSDVYNAGSQIVAPFSTTTLGMCITDVGTDANNNATAQWVYAQGQMTCPANGSSVTLPANLLTANQYVIKAEVTYTYTSPINYWFKAPVVFDQVFYLRPRQSANVTCSDC